MPNFGHGVPKMALGMKPPADVKKGIFSFVDLAIFYPADFAAFIIKASSIYFALVVARASQAFQIISHTLKINEIFFKAAYV